MDIDENLKNIYEYRWETSIKHLLSVYSLKHEELVAVHAELFGNEVVWKYVLKGKSENEFNVYVGKFQLPDSIREPFEKNMLDYLKMKGLIKIMNCMVPY